MAKSVNSASSSGFIYVEEEAAICGYLFKKARDGRWQRRWFETNGLYLTYYKSKKMDKLLAALSLPQVGEIKIIDSDTNTGNDEGLFDIELKSRVYTLKAKSKLEATIWVRVLSQIRDQGVSAVTASPMVDGSTTSLNRDLKKYQSKIQEPTKAHVDPAVDNTTVSVPNVKSTDSVQVKEHASWEKKRTCCLSICG